MDLVTTHYDDAIPACAEAELDRLYGARYASLAHWRMYGMRLPVSTYVASEDGAPVTLLLYRRSQGRVRVLNEGIALGAAEAQSFAAHMFASYPEVSAVSFHFIHARFERPGMAHMLMPCAEDAVVPLPATLALYQSELGASTRSTLKHRSNKLKRDFPSFALRVFEKDQIDERHVRAIIAFNRARMTSKHKNSQVDADEEARIVALARQCGFVTVATIDGQVCAGAINYRLGRNFTARILAHDARYDSYRLGFLCAYLTILECIAQDSGGVLYLGWGQHEYKDHLGAESRQLSHLVLYRSRPHMARHIGLALQIGLAGRLFLWRRALLTCASSSEGAAGTIARRVLNGVRRCKRALARSPAA
ncbi:MAG: GNAT family N-acetyltransferase [Massilia sp.]